MSSLAERRPYGSTHPAHAFLLAASVPAFLGATLGDIAYAKSYEVQWINFASWLIVGGLVFAVAALACGFAALLRPPWRSAGALAGFLVLLACCVLGVIDAFVHARDAWASMPAGLTLSVVVLVLAGIAAWIGFAGLRAGGPP